MVSRRASLEQQLTLPWCETNSRTTSRRFCRKEVSSTPSLSSICHSTRIINYCKVQFYRKTFKRRSFKCWSPRRLVALELLKPLITRAKKNGFKSLETTLMCQWLPIQALNPLFLTIASTRLSCIWKLWRPFSSSGNNFVRGWVVVAEIQRSTPSKSAFNSWMEARI